MADKRFLSLDDLTHMPVPVWLIEGMFEVGSLVMVAGPSSNYKSFLVIDWLMSIVLGKPWNGKRTVPQRVLYALGEGKSNLIKRMEAWMQYNRVDAEQRAQISRDMRVTFEVPQLASKASVDNLLAGLNAENFRPDVIVIDTFARSFVGLDENDAKDTGLWVEQADRLRQAGYTVIFLHHTAKNTEFGLKYRGSTAIMGAMDSAFTLCKDKDNKKFSVLSCVKQKDHDEGEDQIFQILNVKPNAKDEGSIVLVPAVKPVKVDERFTPEFLNEQGMIDTLIKDTSFESDRARARKLAQELRLPDTAAQTKIWRRRQELRELSRPTPPLAPQGDARVMQTASAGSKSLAILGDAVMQR